MSFHVGQQVVCIDTQWPSYREQLHYSMPIKGNVYTIRGYCPLGGVYLCEITSHINPILNAEYSFRADRFRPVRTTDISIFTAMLAPTDRVEA